MKKGSFTLPGEAGYEKLTLELAERFGADVIRDSDGTVLSEEITGAGYGIYSTICIIRDHNEWAKKNMDKLQQTILMTEPRVATEQKLCIHLMEDFFEEQFSVNSGADAMKYWQVYDRTSNVLLNHDAWSYDEAAGDVTIFAPIPWHKYTVSFFAYRIWEEISMYNHTTNNWEKEHLMQIDPIYPETQEYLSSWMKNWCETHPTTTVVRFTSMFYNFVWIWGKSEKRRNIFSDWASYDFTVSPRMLDLFEETYGYALCAEDFINQGKFHVTHMPGNRKKKDYMDFVNRFVVDYGKQLVKIVHDYGKQAYVFYDDSWVGIEPYKKEFEEFGFDGLIKCIFSGFEVRLCAGVKVPVHEVRLHPYLFPVGLGGLPTFMEGGDPTKDAKVYWKNARRALLRTPVDRIGLGGYLHLVQDFPDFVDYMEQLADEFRTIKELHANGKPQALSVKVGVLHYWGSLRSWTLSGHFHETDKNDLIHINEALSGLPVDVSFLSFEDIKNGALDQVDVLINAGAEGSAWSGGDAWCEDAVVDVLTKWVYEGGTFIGVREPSAVEGYDTTFRMSHVLGVDKDTADRICHGKWSFEVDTDFANKLLGTATVKEGAACRLTEETTQVLLANGDNPLVTRHAFGKGMGIYLSSFEVSSENTRLLLELIRNAAKQPEEMYLTDNLYTECAYYPESKILVVINNSDTEQSTTIQTEAGEKSFTIKPFDTIITKLC